MRIVLLLLSFAATLSGQSIPRSIFADPPHNARFPAAMVVLHIPSGGVHLNGVAYLAAGPGPHPTLVLLHGHPGNEKNLDLAQAVRRAGWNAITLNYRGSWGSPGSFSFTHVLEDVDAALAYVRDPANVGKLRIDPARIVLAGHSMGGWATALAASRDHALRGAILISAVNLGKSASDRAKTIARMRENFESLSGVTPEQEADEVIANRSAFDWSRAVDGLGRLPLLVLTADDGLAPGATDFADAIRKSGNHRVTLVHVATDHSWSDARIRLETLVVRWLKTLP